MIRWYHNGNDLDIYVESKKITIPFQDSLNKLFTDFFEKFSSISIDEIISDYKISKKLILLFIKLNIFISIDNCD
jgi:translation elongation factor EF-4